MPRVDCCRLSYIRWASLGPNLPLALDAGTWLDGCFTVHPGLSGGIMTHLRVDVDRIGGISCNALMMGILGRMLSVSCGDGCLASPHACC